METNTMKKVLVSLFMALGLVVSAQAATGGIAWDKAPNKTNDMAALQNGAKVFMNYCMNCHSAAFMRYNRLKDIGLTEQQIKDNLLFATDKIGETMVASVNPKQSAQWFGANPPDLTVISRSRAAQGMGSGPDYLYTYLRTFYVDETKPTGWNNLAFPNIAMPHALWELQGKRVPVFETVQQHGQAVQVLKGWEQVTPGTMTPEQYDQTVGDLVSYMQWMAEPAQNQRVALGVWVMLFLCVLTFFTWRMNAAFWKDVK